jgi:hypothetical protein
MSRPQWAFSSMKQALIQTEILRKIGVIFVFEMGMDMKILIDFITQIVSI